MIPARQINPGGQTTTGGVQYLFSIFIAQSKGSLDSLLFFVAPWLHFFGLSRDTAVAAHRSEIVHRRRHDVRVRKLGSAVFVSVSADPIPHFAAHAAMVLRGDSSSCQRLWHIASKCRISVRAFLTQPSLGHCPDTLDAVQFTVKLGKHHAGMFDTTAGG